MWQRNYPSVYDSLQIYTLEMLGRSFKKWGFYSKLNFDAQIFAQQTVMRVGI